jgi:hypothetical protein
MMEHLVHIYTKYIVHIGTQHRQIHQTIARHRKVLQWDSDVAAYAKLLTIYHFALS